MCATLQRLNQQPQQPDNEEQAGQQPPWMTSTSPYLDDPAAGYPVPQDQRVPPGAAGNTMFAGPSGPAPEEIPGFPMPSGAPQGPFGPQVAQVPPVPQAPQHPMASGQPNRVIQPLPSMVGQAAQPPTQVPTSPLPRVPSGGQRQPAYSYQAQPEQPGVPPNMLSGRLNTSMMSDVPTDQLSTGYLDPFQVWFPEPKSMADTGLNQGLIADLLIKIMYFTSYMSGQEISAVLRLPFYGVIDRVINLMKKEQLCDISGTAGLGEAGYQYILTAKGMERAHQVLARSSYVGAAPVPLAKYIEAIKLQTTNKPAVNKELVTQALRGMTISDELAMQVGAAANAGKSLFLFGSAGNGKTMLTERIATMLGGHIAIPYALEADGQIIQFFDLNSHRPVLPKGTHETDTTKAELQDRRWVRTHRPVVIVGGELTLSSLDLIYNESAGFYEAPFQLKANGGLFLIDDFGRQQVSPKALLNRWIVPLEKNIDYLTLKTGKKLQVPFELFLVLSTNLQPEDLVDDAFLRRIQNKLFVPDPTPQGFYEIFLGQCKAMSIPFDPAGFQYLVNKHYREAGRSFRASHPRDLLRQLLGIARYLNIPPELTPQLLDTACATYFVNSMKK